MKRRALQFAAFAKKRPTPRPSSRYAPGLSCKPGAMPAEDQVAAFVEVGVRPDPGEEAAGRRRGHAGHDDCGKSTDR